MITSSPPGAPGVRVPHFWPNLPEVGNLILVLRIPAAPPFSRFVREGEDFCGCPTLRGFRRVGILILRSPHHHSPLTAAVPRIPTSKASDPR